MRRALRAAAAATGLLGSLACATSMVLAGLGVGTSTAVAGMAAIWAPPAHAMACSGC